MTLPFHRAVPLFAGITALCAAGTLAAQPPHRILHNGRVWTGDRDHPAATAIAIRNDTIVAVGSDRDVLALRGARTRVEDLGQRQVLPGFHDAHWHLPTRRQADLAGAQSAGEIVRRLREFAATMSAGRGITGRGWTPDVFPNNDAHRRYLDAAFPDHPVVLTDRAGCLPRFMEELDSLLARALNAHHGTFGTLIEKSYNLVAVESEDKLVEHCVYTLANPCSAHLVERSHHWKGVSSRRLAYGVAIKVRRPGASLWSGVRRHADRLTSQESKRAEHGRRSKLPEEVELVLERPAIMLELTDAELRSHVLERLREREQVLIDERIARGLRVMGWDAAMKVSPRSAPEQQEERFGRVPSYSASTASARLDAWRRRREFLARYYDALRRFLAGEWRAEFPAGTWLMKVRFGVTCCCMLSTA